MERDDPRLVYVPLVEATTPKSGICTCYQDRWWCMDPERGLIFYRASKRDSLSPQCNSNQAVVDHSIKRMYPWAEVVFIPWVFERINLQDYC